MNMTRFICVFLFMLCCLSDAASEDNIPFVLSSINKKTSQVIFVKSKVFSTEVSTWQYDGHKWQRALPTMKAVVGRNGIANVGKKREGDGKTPSGIFSIKRAFGYKDHIQTGLDYSKVTDQDFWVDDVKSSQYNQWIKGKPQADSFEVLKRKDDLYEYVAVIEYNTDPVVPGNGSAIFLHVWRDSKKGTAGCVALSKRNMRKILKWLNKESNSIIILN